MKYCAHCGRQLLDEAVICPSCGCRADAAVRQDSTSGAANNEKASGGLTVLSFLFPIVGLILWAVQREEKPCAAASYGKAALIGWIVGIAVVVFIWCILLAMAGVL